jgi:hypothetical protein
MIATTARSTYRCLLVSMASIIRSAAPRTITARKTAYRLLLAAGCQQFEQPAVYGESLSATTDHAFDNATDRVFLEPF